MLLYSPGAAEEGEGERGAEIEPVFETYRIDRAYKRTILQLIKVAGGI